MGVATDQQIIYILYIYIYLIRITFAWILRPTNDNCSPPHPPIIFHSTRRWSIVLKPTLRLFQTKSCYPLPELLFSGRKKHHISVKKSLLGILTLCWLHILSRFPYAHAGQEEWDLCRYKAKHVQANTNALACMKCIKRDSAITNDSEQNPMPHPSPPHFLDATSSPNEGQSVWW